MTLAAFLALATVQLMAAISPADYNYNEVNSGLVLGRVAQTPRGCS